MKIKFLIPLFCLFSSLSLFSNAHVQSVNASSSIYNIVMKDNGNYKLVSVNDNTLSEYRIYSSMKIDEICEDAFIDINSSYSVMISSYVTLIDQNAFNSNIASINYTGSELLWNTLDYESDCNVNFYSFDEGFINFWNENIRLTKDDNICNISRITYGQMKLLYSSLNKEDKAVVDSYKDLSGTELKSSIEYLDHYFSTPVNPSVSYLSKDSTISLIIAISLIGMTAIAGLYLLKKKKIIE